MCTNNFPNATVLLLLCGLAFTSCQSGGESTVASDLNSTNPAVAEQARRVQQLEGQVKQQEAVIESEKTKLEALQQQLSGAKENLEGVKKEVRATP
jgi:septal ring factor EnvC (AmiA/AmiB activator)